MELIFLVMLLYSTKQITSKANWCSVLSCEWNEYLASILLLSRGIMDELWMKTNGEINAWFT